MRINKIVFNLFQLQRRRFCNPYVQFLITLTAIRRNYFSLKITGYFNRKGRFTNSGWANYYDAGFIFHLDLNPCTPGSGGKN